MTKFDATQHWEELYKTKALTDVSWYQPIPKTSLQLILGAPLTQSSGIIDIGGGDSFLVDHLLAQGYDNLTVLDISKTAIARAQGRLQQKAAQVNWIVSDMLQFTPEKTYALWHDRAAFHFLTNPIEIDQYKTRVEQAIQPGGRMVLGTFAPNGPTKCSGIPISQYSADQLASLFSSNFKLLNSCETTHVKPFNTTQAFIFCEFQRR